MAITFGSFGDIIATVQAAYKLVEILSARRGAERQYGDLIDNPTWFHEFLNKLLSFWQTRERCAELDTLHNMLRLVVLDAKGEVDTFLDYIVTKYGKRLTSPSKHSPMGVVRKVQWATFESGNIERLQNKLREVKSMVILVQSQANMVQEDRSRDVVSENMKALAEVQAEAASKLVIRIDDLEKKQLEKLDQINDNLGSLSLAVTHLTKFTTEHEAALSRIISKQFTHRMPPSNLDPYFQNRTFLEDSLGWTIQIPLDIVSWTTIHAILMGKFEGRPGLQLLKDHRYAFRDDLTGLEFQQSTPLRSVLRPRQKINMSMVFFEFTKLTSTCPRCHMPTLAMNSSDLRCTTPGCEMEIQRIEEVIDEEQIQSSIKAPVTVKLASDYEDVNDISTMARFPQTLPFQPEDGPEVFKRVRFFSRWEHRLESRGPLLWRWDQYSFWSAVPEEAYIIKRAVFAMLTSTFSGSSDRVDIYRDTDIETTIFFNFGFVGPSIEQFEFTVNVWCKQRKWRIEVMRLLREVEWIKANPSIMVVGHCDPMFLEGPHGIKAQIHRERELYLEIIKTNVE